MIELYNFTNAQTAFSAYGGHACAKKAIVFQGDEYMLKFPDNLHDKGIKNADMSYSNSPLCEYIGSQIYKLCGFNAQEVLLGTYNEKTVVACKNFKKATYSELFNIHEVMASSPMASERSDIFTGSGSDLPSLLECIENSEFSKVLPDLKDRFWDMFVMDAFIGNPDRNNENWGVIRSVINADQLSIAPIYDNGNCLNCRISDTRMQKALDDFTDMQSLSHRGYRCFHTIDGRKIKPFQLMQSMKFPDCTEAIKRVVPNIDVKKITALLNDLAETNVISATQRKYYGTILAMRFYDALLPMYEAIIEYAPSSVDEVLQNAQHKLDRSKLSQWDNEPGNNPKINDLER